MWIKLNENDRDMRARRARPLNNTSMHTYMYTL